MNRILLFFTFSILFVFGGGGCVLTDSLEDRVSQYEIERDECIQFRRDRFETNNQSDAWGEYEQRTAEIGCTVTSVAEDHYEQDPEGVVELCLRSKEVSELVYERVYEGSFTEEELNQLQAEGRLSDVTVNDAGEIVSIGEQTHQEQREHCQQVIEAYQNLSCLASPWRNSLGLCEEIPEGEFLSP